MRKANSDNLGIAALAGLALSCWMVGCAELVPKPEVDLAAEREEIYARTEGVFTRGFFYKPREDESLRETFQLAPLIVQELTGNAAEPPEDDRIANGYLSFHTDRPVVYFNASIIQMNGQNHDQISFSWFYPLRVEHDYIRWRGCRMTLDSDGFPIIWEVLGSGLAPETLYVSKSLERAAAEAYGPPLAGRRYSIETETHSHPDVLVTRILDDGPQPMGPFVYLTAENLKVMTFTCRCMPSQVRDLPHCAYYELRPLSELKTIKRNPARLNRMLRLPQSF
ncbi:MAG: hypothetical protein ACE5EQ_05275 [Phycisphaerae bacterium]